MSYVLSDTTYINSGLIQECEDITGLGAAAITGDPKKLRTFVRRLNQAKDRLFTLAFNYDQLWSFDDRTYADGDQKLPIATTNLDSGVGDILFSSELLSVIQVFIKDPSGNYVEITQQDDRNAPDAYLTRASGTPTKYELVGNSMIFDKIPDYTPTKTANKNQGVKVVFKRNGSHFPATDSATAIGVPDIFFEFLANYACEPYVSLNGLKNIRTVEAKIQIGEAAIARFIANRAKPKRGGLRVKVESNK